MTSPLPSTKLKGLPAVLASNCLPFSNLPMYLTQASVPAFQRHSQDSPHAQSLAGPGNGSISDFDILNNESRWEGFLIRGHVSAQIPSVEPYRPCYRYCYACV